MRGYSAFESGLIQLPGALGPVVMLRTGVQLYQRVGARRILIVGSAGLAVTSGMLLLVDMQTSVLWISCIMLLRGIALALGFVCMQATAFATIGPERIGRASSLFSTQRQVAASVGVAALATVVSLTMNSTHIGHGDPLALQLGLTAFHNAAAVSALIACVGVLFALRVPNAPITIISNAALPASS